MPGASVRPVAGKSGSKSRARRGKGRRRPERRLWRRVVRWTGIAALSLAGIFVAAVAVAQALNPPTTPYMQAERARLGEIRHEWVDADDIAPVMLRSVVAAEDANFCLHWGLDLDAIQDALEDGAQRGASTITQQVAKNVYLWHGRSWGRKALEAVIAPQIELFWSKRRILEVYLNIAEFDEGVFGVEAAAQHHFGIPASDLSARQAALLAAVLPDPKARSASQPSDFVRRRAAAIMDGAATIAADGRAACFEDSD